MKNIFLFLFFFSGIVIAQNHDNDKVEYLDFNEKPTSKANAVYYEFTTAYKEDIWKYQKFFISSSTKAFLVEKYYFDGKDHKQGKYNSYYKDGIIRKEGIYKDNIKFGPWKNYRKVPFTSQDSIDNSSYLQSLEYYKNDKRNGKFKEFYEDGSTRGEGQYKEDQLFGECKWYHRNSQMSSLEFYKEKGKIRDIQQWDENGLESDKKIKSNHNKEASKKLLSSNIKRYLSNGINKNIYKMHPNQNGKVYVQILLDKTGEIHVVKTKSTFGISLEYEKEIKRVLEHMPDQKPTYYHNQLVYWRFTLPIVIRSKNIDNIKYKSSY